MRSSRTLVGLCVVILLVFVAFSYDFGSGLMANAKLLNIPKPTQAVQITLTADGTDPMPSPIPIPRPWFRANS